MVVTSGVSLLVVDMAPAPLQHPRYRASSKVVLEVPDTDIGIVDSALEDISCGGMRVSTPVALHVGQRVVATILLSGSEPIVALAEVLGVQEGGRGGDLVASLRFTLMAPAQRARLAVSLERPPDKPPDADPDGHGDQAFRASM